jgi:TatD DNase family protein
VSLRFYDAHNHLQDERFNGRQQEIMAATVPTGMRRMVVNGACESDWPEVLDLAKKHPQILPSFGYHPWYIHERTPDWKKNLLKFLDATPSAVGEIGLDRWKPELSYDGQEEVFIWQLRLAAERNLPASIHCLQTWGRMLEILQKEPRPARGFLLHSYGGPKEMVKSFVDLGAYFSLPGYFAHERKERHRDTFKHIPLERLLIETDAPTQYLPDELNQFPLTDLNNGNPLNHPANLRAVYEFASGLREMPLEELTAKVEENFLRLFGGL